MNTITKRFQLTGTQAAKVASKGFMSQKDCKGYMLSSSLSPLNEKFFTMLFAEVVINHCNEIRLLAKTSYNDYYNGFAFHIKGMKRNQFITTLEIEVTAHNSYKQGHTTCNMNITYKTKGKKAEIKPRKYAGEIKQFLYNGSIYPVLFDSFEYTIK